MNEKVLDAVFQDVKHNEGFVPRLTPDPANNGSMNIGHANTVILKGKTDTQYHALFRKAGINYDYIVNQGGTITPDQAERLTKEYIKDKHDILKKFMPKFDELPEKVQIALFDMAYQGGVHSFDPNNHLKPNGRFKKITKAINDEDFDKASQLLLSGEYNWINGRNQDWNSNRSTPTARAKRNASYFANADSADRPVGATVTDGDDLPEREVPQEKDNGHALEKFDGYRSMGKAATGNRVRDLQTQLLGAKDENGNSYQCGDYGPKNDGIDGKMGPKTVEMLKKFQKDHDLPVTGKLDAKTQTALDKECPLETKANVPLDLEPFKTKVTREPDESWRTGDFSNDDKTEKAAKNLVKALLNRDYKAFAEWLDDLPSQVAFDKNNTVKVTYGSPLPGAQVTSPFGHRDAPNEQASSDHKGMDLDNGKDGSPILATAPGIVIDKGKEGKGGNFIKILHPDGNTSIYMHLSDKNFNLVKEGDAVAGGEKIAELGNTGNSTGSHLHFEIRDAKGKQVNPTALANVTGAAYKGPQLTDKQVDALIVLASIMDLKEVKKDKMLRQQIMMMAANNDQVEPQLLAKDADLSDFKIPPSTPNAARKNQNRTTNM